MVRLVEKRWLMNNGDWPAPPDSHIYKLDQTAQIKAIRAEIFYVLQGGLNSSFKALIGPKAVNWTQVQARLKCGAANQLKVLNQQMDKRNRKNSINSLQLITTKGISQEMPAPLWRAAIVVGPDKVGIQKKPSVSNPFNWKIAWFKYKIKKTRPIKDHQRKRCCEIPHLPHLKGPDKDQSTLVL